MTKELEEFDNLPAIITNPNHENYEYWKDPADRQWIGRPRTPPADPNPNSYKNPHPEFQTVLKADPRGYDFGFHTLSPEDQTTQIARLAAMTPRPTGSSSTNHTSSQSESEDSNPGSGDCAEVPTLVAVTPAADTGCPQGLTL